MHEFFEKVEFQNHPLRILVDFLAREKANEQAAKYSELRFVGYVLDIGYDTITIITSDPFKLAVSGVPRNSLLIMVPGEFNGIPPHFTLLRVLESAPTPLSSAVQQTYFELQKKSMPELDVFTQSELQWGALKTGVLGMIYSNPDPDKPNQVEFSGDLNNFVSAHKYKVYAPNAELLDLIINSMVSYDSRFKLGSLRLTECRLAMPGNEAPTEVPVYISTKDFMGARTAMFGKTRLGKSNVVKLIAQSLIETTENSHNVGQLIFDINGEYANDNPQDGNLSLRSGYPQQCEIYAITPKTSTPSKPLKLNFYENPDTTHEVLGSLLRQDNRTSAYIQSFASVSIPSIAETDKLSIGSDKARAIRKIQMYWAILQKAGFQADETRLRTISPSNNTITQFNPNYPQPLRQAAYAAAQVTPVPQGPRTLAELVRELEVINRFRRDNPSSPHLLSTSGNPQFEADDIALLEFLEPQPGRSGPSLIQGYRMYHDPQAGDFIKQILAALDVGKTVILDLGNANEQVMRYFSEGLSRAVLEHQVTKFTNNKLGNHFMQLYFEEAHNLFPSYGDVTEIYSRFAKEGAKFHIGMIYSTQSPSTISRDLLAQTENFFIAHLASQDDVNALARVNIAYESLKGDILNAKTPGYMRMLTRSHRFVVSMQARKFTANSSNSNGSQQPKA